MANIISVPISCKFLGESVLTDPCVPTGIKTGVLIIPCDVFILPIRALQLLLVFSSSKCNKKDPHQIQKWELNLKNVFISAFFIGLFVGLIINIIANYLYLNQLFKLITSFILIILISLSLLLIRFYRDPDRIPPEEKNIILSPADGKVIYVKNIEEGKVPFSEKKGGE